jgi:hypothetical protein
MLFRYLLLNNKIIRTRNSSQHHNILSIFFLADDARQFPNAFFILGSQSLSAHWGVFVQSFGYRVFLMESAVH